MDPLVGGDDRTSPDPVPLDQFLVRFPDPAALRAESNRQLTSTRGGIGKADAVLRHAEVFVAHGITTRLEAMATAAGAGGAFEAVNRELKRIPGEGADGVRRGYMWMLLGDENGVKPDAMVLRWLPHHDAGAHADTARLILRRVAERLSAGRAVAVSPWMGPWAHPKVTSR